MLKQLGLLLEDDEYVRLCRAETLTMIRTIVEECETSFRDLDEIIGKYVGSGRMRFLDRLKWPYIERKVNLLRVNLERLKSALVLTLEVVKYARGVVEFVTCFSLCAVVADKHLETRKAMMKWTEIFS
jgi:hypothetical protein